MFILAENRDELKEYLKTKAWSFIYYGKTHQHKAFIDKFGNQNYANAERLVKKVISLPFINILIKTVSYISKSVNDFYKTKY